MVAAEVVVVVVVVVQADRDLKAPALVAHPLAPALSQSPLQPACAPTEG
jgi:hypothetical protein